jgi:ERCC4-type nuclease
MVTVVVDRRERSNVHKYLNTKGLMLDFRVLDEGDYIVSGYAIERKTVQDFISSLYSGRLFNQAYRLGEAYYYPILVVEGNLQLTLKEIKNPRAFWGALITLSFGYGLKVFFTRDPEETAELISVLAKHPPESKSRKPIIARKLKPIKIRESQLALVQGLPGVGSILAEKLLKSFGTPRRIFGAPESDLIIKGRLRRATASKVTSLLNANFNKLDKESAQLKLCEVKP